MNVTLRLLPQLLRQHRWLLAIALGTATCSVIPTSPVLGQDSASVSSEISPSTDSVDAVDNLAVPVGSGETITDIQVHFVDHEGAPINATAADRALIADKFELEPGDIYEPELAQRGLSRVGNFSVSGQANLTLEPTAEPNEVVMAVTVAEPNSFFFDLGSGIPRPTALRGPERPTPVPATSNEAGGISVGARFGLANIGNNNQTLSLGIEGGENNLGVDLDFRHWLDNDSGYGINFANSRAKEPEFDNGEIEVETPSGDEPTVHRIGGGVEYFRSLAPNVEAALGLSYQQVTVREDIFSNDIVRRDELGNPFTVSDDGRDDLLTVNFSADFDKRNNTRNPSSGSRLLFGSDQSIPIGDADILFNRLSANYTQYLPLNIFGFSEGPRTLILNVQGGTIIGDAPPYDAFSLGGSSSVRGYSSGELGTGESFVQATAEYRFPAFSFNAFDDDIDVGGLIFFDYATDLGTGDEVIGEPAEVRNKPGDGFGYGVGMRALTPVGTLRLELGISDEGDSNVIIKIGDRF
ncbi:MAG: BamA/TamA family outer membrane protein [Cyanobacteria bacterium P01_B01_bin.77]